MVLFVILLLIILLIIRLQIRCTKKLLEEGMKCLRIAF